MTDIIGLNTKLYGINLRILPAKEQHETEQEETKTPERVPNPIVSESYARAIIQQRN